MLDELPIWGYVGELEAKSVNFARAVDNTTKYFLFTHLDFSIAYNRDRIIEVSALSAALRARQAVGTGERAARAAGR